MDAKWWAERKPQKINYGAGLQGPVDILDVMGRAPGQVFYKRGKGKKSMAEEDEI